MPNSFIKSKRTDKDIIEITLRSFSDFGETQTIVYMDALAARLQWLADNPHHGHSFTSNRTDREYLYYNQVSHVIYYRKRKNDIFITRILHKNMLPSKHL